MKFTNNSNTTFYYYLDKFANLVLLNLLALFCSIPIITIGATATSLHYAVTKLVNDEPKPFQAFFRSFKQNFIQSTIIWLLLSLIGFGVIVCVWFSQYINNVILTIVATFSLFVWFAIISWIFPLLSKFYFKTQDAIKNAFLCAVSCWPITLLMVITNFLPFVIFVISIDIFLRIGFIWIVIWFSLATLCNSRLLKKPFETLEASIS